MIVGVEGGCLGVKDQRLKVGVYQVAKSLLENLGKIDKKNDYIIYSFYPIDREVMKGFGERTENKVLNSKGWLKFQLPLAILKDKIDVFLGLSQAIPKPLPFSPHPYTIGFIYDLAFERFPKFYTDSYKKLSKNTRDLVKRSDKIITISKSSKKDITDYYKISSDKISVVYPGIWENVHLDVSPSRCTYQKKYFLFVGALKPIKNVPIVIKAFEYFCKIHGLISPDEDYFFYIVGGDKWLDAQILKTLNNVSEDIRKKIKFLGFVSDEDLVQLYKKAIALVMPSFYEGYGLPILEAIRLGCPVLGSNAGSIPEVIGNAGLLFDPKDEKGIGEAMVKVIKNKKLRDELVKKGLERSKKFSAEKFAEEVLSIINSPKPEK